MGLALESNRSDFSVDRLHILDLTYHHYMLGTILHSHYQIVKVLGIGKSGATYLAKDLDLIDSPLFVVKKIEPIYGSAEIPPLAEKLFEIQVSIAHQLGQHPQIPTLITKFEVGGDRYLVREYVDGELLSQELTPGAIWSQTQVFDFLVDLMGILKFVHNFNYIHQDINPHNIIRDCQSGLFHLIGYSCVKNLGNTWQNLPNDDAQNLNDPSYTPYEQEQNAPKLTSDIYAVGAIAIQALTGRFPIEKDSYSYELKWRDEVNIDSKLADIINRMVRPDYRNRYQSADEVFQALEAFALTQIPVRQRRSTPYLWLGAAAGTLLIGFGATKFFSTATAKTELARSAVATNTTSAKARTQNWQDYTDKTASIKVKYPPTWQQQDIDNIVTGERAIFTNPEHSKSANERESVSIRVENLTDPQTSLTSYTQSTIAEISKYYQAATIVESSPINIANRPGNLIVYTGKDENLLAVKNLEVWTIDRGKAYILTYRATPDRYYQSLDAAMTTINSLEIR